MPRNFLAGGQGQAAVVAPARIVGMRGGVVGRQRVAKILPMREGVRDCMSPAALAKLMEDVIDPAVLDDRGDVIDGCRLCAVTVCEVADDVEDRHPGVVRAALAL